ncbi:hypothetical protein [Nostoc punctiforme]|uniref:Uncharacterized protein n=2 Tax=Nostoc punctiforme TaxID=272131 RepID=B2ITE9_NOSP7|nr:hypothetical protein [Nostoc punctiforme]ACC81180.1 hypothetical protein Npun_R2626 [Nostoc punctiforme PCC 73102]RCJ41113.1 hypothetical protein A6769_38835 [Nostoc punctiforme NIES-2108]
MKHLDSARWNPEIIQASTPGFLALTGLFIIIVAAIAPGINSANQALVINAGVGAIAAAGGLARGGSSDSTNVRGNVNIDSIQDPPKK